MISNKDLQQLVDAGSLPPVQELDLGNTLEISRFLKMSVEDRKKFEGAVVVDGANWVAKDRNGDYFSGDGKYVGKHIRRMKFSYMKLGENGTLMSVKYLGNLYKEEGTTKPMTMENGMDLGNGMELDDLMNSLESEVKANNEVAQTPMVEFGGDTTKPKTSAGVNGLRKEITAQLEKTHVANFSLLQDFNQQHSSVIGYITNVADTIKFSASSVVVKEGGKPVLREGVSDDIRAAAKQGDKVPKEHYKQVSELRVRHAKPSKILGVVFEMPQGGLVPIDLFAEADKLKPDTSKTDRIKQMVSREQFFSFLEFYFGNLIKENPETHGGAAAAGELKQTHHVTFKTVEGQLQPQQVVNRRWTSSKRSSVLMATNFLPIKTYKTMAVTGTLTAEQEEQLNYSAFASMDRVTASSENGMSQLARLSAEDAKRVSKKDDKITSVFFSPNVNEREAIVVTPFWGRKGDEPLSVVEIPLKFAKVNEEKNTVTPTFITYSVTDEKIADEEYKSNTSLFSGRYATFVKAAGDAVTVEKLRALTRRTTSKAKSNVLSNQQVIAATFGLANRSLDPNTDIMFNGSKEGDFDAFEKQVNRMLTSQ